MTLSNYGWSKFLLPIVEKVMASSPEELLALNHQMAAEGIPKAIPLPNRDSNENLLPLPGIDPFTFLTHTACRDMTLSNKGPMIRFLEKNWGLPKSNCSEEEREFPMVKQGKKPYFPLLTHERKDDDIDSLGRFATACYEGNDREASEFFPRCLDIKYVGLAKLTIGLFWLRPKRYLSLDKYTQGWLKDQSISNNVTKDVKLSWDNYLQLCEKAISHFNQKPYEICCKVYPR